MGGSARVCEGPTGRTCAAEATSEQEGDDVSLRDRTVDPSDGCRDEDAVEDACLRDGTRQPQIDINEGTPPN